MESVREQTRTVDFLVSQRMKSVGIGEVSMKVGRIARIADWVCWSCRLGIAKAAAARKATTEIMIVEGGSSGLKLVHAYCLTLLPLP